MWRNRNWRWCWTQLPIVWAVLSTRGRSQNGAWRSLPNSPDSRVGTLLTMEPHAKIPTPRCWTRTSSRCIGPLLPPLPSDRDQNLPPKTTSPPPNRNQNPRQHLLSRRKRSKYWFLRFANGKFWSRSFGAFCDSKIKTIIHKIQKTIILKTIFQKLIQKAPPLHPRRRGCSRLTGGSWPGHEGVFVRAGENRYYYEHFFAHFQKENIGKINKTKTPRKASTRPASPLLRRDRLSRSTVSQVWDLEFAFWLIIVFLKLKFENFKKPKTQKTKIPSGRMHGGPCAGRAAFVRWKQPPRAAALPGRLPWAPDLHEALNRFNEPWGFQAAPERRERSQYEPRTVPRRFWCDLHAEQWPGRGVLL